MSVLEQYGVRFGPGYRWLATGTVMLGTIATTTTATIVNVALTDIMGAFGMGTDQIQWLSTGFLAAMTATMLLTAWALDHLGYRATFGGAMALFILGSLLGAASTSGAMVIAARVIQGAASGIVQPLAMVVMSQVFPPAQRGRAMGIYGVGIVLAPALGPTVGGLLVDQYSWRDVFLVVVPFCLAGLLAASLLFPGRQQDHHKPRVPFDGLGFALLCLALVSLLTGLSNGQRHGWDSAFILGCFALAALAAAAFIWWELHCAHPLLHLKVFRVGPFVAACLVAFALGAGIYGSTYIIPLFLQTVQGYTPTRSGLLMMPAGLILALVFPIAGQLSDKVRPQWPVMAGLGIFGLSCWLQRSVDVDTAFWQLALWVLFGRIGLGLMLPALNAGGLRTLPHEMLAQGAGSLNFIRQLGGAFGVNLLSVFIDRRGVLHGEALAQTLTPDNPAFGESVRRLSLFYSHWGNPFGEHMALKVNPGVLSFMEQVLLPKARLLAYQDGFFVVALVFFLAMVPAWLMSPRKAR
ncbi:MDR family MFS transporter [Gallaecimonas kandeliae]|uniref:MDR family MFS transporter n=1 Tax=Gallaecimonas kandeliae TaxID=3029055 RepID=UPI00264776EC|nr:MDR family MFS transporter [Gallaecimonas kandeliae]WKE65230.1 MDR family MFS transporter [Gallaecimonas kandeliae]